jgi:hypothetical protein
VYLFIGLLVRGLSTVDSDLRAFAASIRSLREVLFRFATWVSRDAKVFASEMVISRSRSYCIDGEVAALGDGEVIWGLSWDSVFGECSIASGEKSRLYVFWAEVGVLVAGGTPALFILSSVALRLGMWSVGGSVLEARLWLLVMVSFGSLFLFNLLASVGDVG